jgi:putative membrane protein
MGFLIKLILNSIIFVALAKLLPDAISISDGSTAIVASLVLAFLNQFLKPILKMIGFPITLITFGLFTIVINAVVLLIVDRLVDGFTIHGFWWTIIISIVMSLIQSWITATVKDIKI